MRRRAFLVRERTKLNVKIKGVLTYEGVKPPDGYGLYTWRGREWLEGLGLESVRCYLRVMATLREEIRRLSLEFRHIAEGDEDFRLLTSIPGIGYYIALLVKAEAEDISRFRSGDHLASYSGLVPSTHSSGGESRGTATSPGRAPSGSGGRWWGRAGPPEVRFAGNPVLPQGGRE